MPRRPRLTPQVANLRRAVRELLLGLPEKPVKILIALSGGSDSVGLLAAAAFEAKSAEIDMCAVVIDHQLQSGSDEVALLAQQTAISLGVSAEIVRVEVSKPGLGMEAAAREVRYQALEQSRVRLKADWVVLGHSLDDQAETVLLGLTRGSGLTSISGMQPVDHNRRLLRPLLGQTRTDIRQAVLDQGLRYWDDPHNEDDRYLRVKIRKLLPELEDVLGPGLRQSLVKTAQIAQTSQDLISGLAQQLVEKSALGSSAKELRLSVTELSSAHPAVLLEAIRKVVIRAGAKNVSMAQLEQVSELVTNWHGQKSSVLSSITVERVNNELCFRSKPLKPGAC